MICPAFYTAIPRVHGGAAHSALLHPVPILTPALPVERASAVSSVSWENKIEPWIRCPFREKSRLSRRGSTKLRISDLRHSIGKRGVPALHGEMTVGQVDASARLLPNDPSLHPYTESRCADVRSRMIQGPHHWEFIIRVSDCIVEANDVVVPRLSPTPVTSCGTGPKCEREATKSRYRSLSHVNSSSMAPSDIR
jgi:hypothetical protein